MNRNIGRLELMGVLASGIVHILIKLFCDGLKPVSESLNRPQHWFNLAAVIGWGGYLLWRLLSGRVKPSELGFRRKGLLKSILVGLPFMLVAIAGMVAFGGMTGVAGGPSLGFWVLMPLYPFWGLAQQFALQSLVVRNMRGLCSGEGVLALGAGVVFSFAHFPNFMLMALTFPLGVFITWIFTRYRNIWAAGVLHGILGVTAYYFVLGQDPGTEILSILKGLAG